MHTSPAVRASVSESDPEKSRADVSLAETFIIFSVSALFHVAVVFIVHLACNGQPVYPDALRYEQQSMLMVHEWRYGYNLDIRALQQISGSFFFGYSAIMALCRLATGGGWLSAKTALSLLSSTGAIAAYGLATVSGRGRNRAVVVGVIVGTSPSLLLWDAWGLKDGLVTTLLLWFILLLVRLRFTLACFATLAGVLLCMYLRAAAAIFLATALIARVRFRRGYFVGLIVAAAAVWVFILPRVWMLLGLFNTSENGSGSYLSFSGEHAPRSLLSNPQYFIHFLFGPFPWSFGAGTATPQRWLYLGTIIWICCLALVPDALKQAWKDTSGAGAVMVVASSAYTIAYFLNFGAEFYRQRSVIECMTMVLIVIYSPLSLGVAVTRLLKWIGVVADLAILQTLYLTPTLWSKFLAIGVMCLMILAALVKDPFVRLKQGRVRLRIRRPSQCGRQPDKILQ